LALDGGWLVSFTSQPLYNLPHLNKNAVSEPLCCVRILQR
jgi:hypothetical protein